MRDDGQMSSFARRTTLSMVGPPCSSTDVMHGTGKWRCSIWQRVFLSASRAEASKCLPRLIIHLRLPIHLKSDGVDGATMAGSISCASCVTGGLQTVASEVTGMPINRDRRRCRLLASIISSPVLLRSASKRAWLPLQRRLENSCHRITAIVQDGTGTSHPALASSIKSEFAE
jgi:hypothetical protein